jgi:hypothetical protein
MTETPSARLRRLALIVIPVFFGLVTLKEGSANLFGTPEIVIVPFVLWYNFVAGAFYVLAGVGFARRAAWAPKLALGIAVGNGLVLLALLVHIGLGRPFAERTPFAMIFRTLLWVALAYLARYASPSVGRPPRSGAAG